MFDVRTLLAYAAVALLALATVWSLSFTPEPAADFTFVNNTEVKSLDPALVTGQPEGRVLQGLFEGIVSLDAKTLQPVPGIAESWELSDDRLTYTFHLRENARWSDGTRITAHDCQWSMRRFLDPLTASQYAYQMWYIKNAKRYTVGPLEPGDHVEVELNEKPAGALPFARGILLRGKLVKIEEKPAKRFVVEIDGKPRTFIPGEDCTQVVLDERELGIHAIDEGTLEITLNSPTPYFFSLLGFYPLFPVQQKCLETFGFPEWTKPGNIVTSGPYDLGHRRIRERIRLVRSETYWDRANVKCATIDALAVESAVTGLNLYLTGKADWIATIPPPIVPELLAQKRDDLEPTPELSVYFYRINTTKPPLDNKLVRQALARAMNKEAITKSITRAGEIPALSFTPPGLPGYDPPQGPSYDPDAARKLLVEAGYPDGSKLPKIQILYNTDEGHQSIAELVQDQWKRTLGIQVEPLNQPWGAYLASQRELKYSVARAGWGGDYLDPNTFLDLFVTGGENNETGWGNAEFDRLIHQAAVETDSAKRLEMLKQAEQILLDEVPVIPIYFRVSKNMVRPYVHGFYRNALDIHPLKGIWVDQAAKDKLFGEAR